MAKKPKAVASASTRKPTRARPKMNEALVEKYLVLLEEALGDNVRFPKLIERLKVDSDVTQADAVSIAGRFMAPMPASTSRSKAIDKIISRHTNLVSVQLRQKAVRGRSAA